MAGSETRRLLIATTNQGKLREMAEILSAAGLDLDLVMLDSYANAPEVEETGATFLENARLKARSAAAFSGIPAIADDGGLMIDALQGLPGVKSHRFLGEDTPFPVKMSNILDRMRAVTESERTCRFQCAVVITCPDGREAECIGTCEGRVAHELKGANGFGYDPLFLVPELGRHMAELRPEEKNSISHRGKALACVVEKLRELL